MPQNNNIGCIAFLFIAFGLIPLGVIANDLRQWSRAAFWVSTEATVINVEVGWKRSSPSSPRNRTTLAVEYEYEIGNRTYRSTSIVPFVFELTNTDKQELASLLADAKKNAETVTCYVNAENHRESCLNRDFPRTQFLGICGICVVLVSVAMLLLRWRRGKAKSISASEQSNAPESRSQVF